MCEYSTTDFFIGWLIVSAAFVVGMAFACWVGAQGRGQEGGGA